MAASCSCLWSLSLHRLTWNCELSPYVIFVTVFIAATVRRLRHDDGILDYEMKNLGFLRAAFHLYCTVSGHGSYVKSLNWPQPSGSHEVLIHVPKRAKQKQVHTKPHNFHTPAWNAHRHLDTRFGSRGKQGSIDHGHRTERQRVISEPKNWAWTPAHETVLRPFSNVSLGKTEAAVCIQRLVRTSEIHDSTGLGSNGHGCPCDLTAQHQPLTKN